MILYITRKYPPSIGGMQNVNFHLVTHLQKITDLTLIAWGGSQKWLLIIFMNFLAKSIFYLLKDKRVKVIFLGDALLIPLGLLLKTVFRKPLIVWTHGLDVNWPPFLYQVFMRRFLKHADRVICISQKTKQLCLERGVPERSIRVIPNGVIVHAAPPAPRPMHPDILPPPLRGRPTILSVGRFIERKGFHFFIAEVLPRIAANIPEALYLLAGDGPYRNKIEAAIKKTDMHGHVHLAGIVDQATLNHFYALADIFVMPNLSVPGDTEGFGIVALEAGARGLWVVASRADGITDAVQDGYNGILVDPGQAGPMADVITRFLNDTALRGASAEKARAFVLSHYSWEKIGLDFWEIIKELAPPEDKK